MGIHFALLPEVVDVCSKEELRFPDIKKKCVWHFVGFCFKEKLRDTFSSGLTVVMHPFFCQYLKCICNTFAV